MEPPWKQQKEMTIYNNLPGRKVQEEEPKVELKSEDLVTAEAVGKFIGIYLMGPLVVMLCWNYVVPYLFALKGINYLHALCIIIIARFLQNDK
jgi:hypothetical protein|tara:strand:- start:22958 stop:23236 length:279 start_codon:yes stop_codon:yes gene_type:complete